MNILNQAIYLCWEKRLKVKVDRIEENIIEIDSTNYNLFDISTLHVEESFLEKEIYKIVQQYYSAYLYQDILGDWILTKVRGGINTARGHVIHQYCTTKEEGLRQIERLRKIRKQRKYKLISENY